MKTKIVIAYLLTSFFFIGISACQEEGQSVDKIINRMKTWLNLTQDQITAVEPIVEEYAGKRRRLMENSEIPLMTNKKNIEIQMRRLKEEENKKLSEVLTPDQMRKLDQGESVKRFLNQDQIDGSDTIPEHSGMSF